jgi:ABC-type transport system substrate-binding protein
LPVATPYATPRPQGGLFEDRELGLTVSYPFFWNRSSGAVPGTVVQLANQADNVFVLIIRTPLPADESLEKAATGMHGRLGEWLGGLEVLNSQASTVADGTAAWRSEYLLTYEGYGVTVQGFFLSVPHQRQLITLAAYGQSQHLTPERTTVDDILNSVKLHEPEVYGIPRSQAFIFQDFETGDPRYYDPATGPADRRVFGGLVGFNPQLALQPDLAESWDISADGTVYTFYLNPKAKFHDGRPVTAADVVYSWERAADPKTRSQQAGTFLGDIVGFAEKQRGEADSISGLKVLDESTLEVTIDGPKPYFLMKLTWGPALVVDRANVESGAEWYRTPNGTGPYRLLRWEEDKARLYQRNEQYHLEPATIPYLIGRLDAWNGLRMYELGELDHVALNSFQAAALRNSENPMRESLRESPSMCTSFVTFDTSRAPFDDPKVRQAFALAVDRQRYQERVLEGSGISANGLYPPGLPGFNPALQRLPHDQALARQRLAETKYASEQLPPITITTAGQGFYTNPAIGVLAQMWQETLGAQIKIEALEPVSYV